MSRGRHRRPARESAPPPEWPLAVAFWLPIVVGVGYLAWAHGNHASGALQWLLLAVLTIATIRRVARWRRRPRSALSHPADDARARRARH